MTRVAGFAVVGTRPKRHDGVDKVTGRALYGTDTRAASMLHGKVLRSPHAHARIRSIDTSRAEALEGAYAVITGLDMPDPGERLLSGGEAGPGSVKYKSANLLARDKVLYEGQAVAAVAAVDAHTAEEAARLIDVRYEPLEPVLDVRCAVEPEAPLLHGDLFTDAGGVRATRPSNVASHLVYAEGDIEASFAQADLVVEREFTTATVHQGTSSRTTHSRIGAWTASSPSNAAPRATSWSGTSFPACCSGRSRIFASSRRRSGADSAARRRRTWRRSRLSCRGSQVGR